jgi:hypothetical protein
MSNVAFDWIALPPPIWEALGSNLGRKIDNARFLLFSSVPLDNACIVRLLPSVVLPIHDPLIVPPFESGLTMATLNKSRTNKTKFPNVSWYS